MRPHLSDRPTVRTVALAAAMLLTLGLAGCGSDDGDPAAENDTTNSHGSTGNGDGDGDGNGDSAELDVCAMVSDAEVETALGESATATDESTGDLYACSWKGNGDALNALSVSVYVHPDAETAKQQYDATREGLEGSDIMGLGDEASYNESFGLEVLSGRYDISVDNTGPTEKESDIAIAQRILEQLS